MLEGDCHATVPENSFPLALLPATIIEAFSSLKAWLYPHAGRGLSRHGTGKQFPSRFAPCNDHRGVVIVEGVAVPPCWKGTVTPRYRKTVSLSLCSLQRS